MLEILRASKTPLNVSDIVDKLNLDEELESTLKTTPRKRVSATLRYLEKRGHVTSYKFFDKGEVLYRHKGDMIKDLIVHVMLSNLHDFYKNEFMSLMSPVLTEENRAIVDKEIEVYKTYLKDKGTTEQTLKEVREKTIRLVLDNKNDKDYFS